MTTKEILLDQFNSCFDINGWFVALKNTLNNLTVDEAIWKIPNLDNSIWEILAHLNFYNERYLKRFKGEAVETYQYRKPRNFCGCGKCFGNGLAGENRKV